MVVCSLALYRGIFIVAGGITLTVKGQLYYYLFTLQLDPIAHRLSTGAQPASRVTR